MQQQQQQQQQQTKSCSSSGSQECGKYVSVIQHTIVKIQVFFIFACYICFAPFCLIVVRNGVRDYDSVSDELDSTDWTFFTVILMLNVLIGKDQDQDQLSFPINYSVLLTYPSLTDVVVLSLPLAYHSTDQCGVHLQGDNGWRFAWVESQLRYIQLLPHGPRRMGSKDISRSMASPTQARYNRIGQLIVRQDP